MRSLWMLGGVALALAGNVVAAEIGQPGSACTGEDCVPTSSLEPQPVAVVPMVSATAFTPPTPLVTQASVTQAVPVNVRETGTSPATMTPAAMPGGMPGGMPAMAMPQPMSMGGDMQSPSTKALMEANAKMHAGMNGPFTGDADVDFVRGMIAHHQGAIEMAKVELIYGKDPDMKMLANDIMKAQGNEIELMQKWLAQHGPKPAGAKADAAKAKPKPPVMKAKAKPIGQLLEDTKPAPADGAPVSAKPAVEAVSASVPSVLGTPPAASATPAAAHDMHEMQMPLLDGMAPANK